jgi:hypothetical protein
VKIYTIKLNPNQVVDFIRFSLTYNVSIYFTWKDEEMFGPDAYYVTCTDQPDPKITTEEKSRLIGENYSKQIIKTTDL